MSSKGKCLLPDSDDKFDEAHYFINMMIMNYHKPDIFRFNLNAFLQALRNVTFIIQSELSHLPNFDKWWEKQQEIMRSDRILVQFRESRNLIVKQRSLNFKSTVNIGKFENLTYKLGLQMEVSVDEYSSSILDRAKEAFFGNFIDKNHSFEWEQLGVKRLWLVEELGDGEVVDLCDVAWSRIGKILSNAHTFFGFEQEPPKEHGHNFERAQILLETDLDPTLPKKWGWID